MLVVGLLGGIACGKSLVARQFAERGAVILDADRSGHEVLCLPEVEAAARARWGDAIFGPDGHIERAKLASIVFAPGARGLAELAYLESLTHPRIGERLQQQVAAGEQAGRQVAILDAPVMLKAGWQRYCQRLVFIDAPWEQRVLRAQQRGWSEAELKAREARQPSLDVKRSVCDTVIDNSGTIEATGAQVERLWHELLRG